MAIGPSAAAASSSADHLVGGAGDERDLGLDRCGEETENPGAGRGAGRVREQVAVEVETGGADT